MHFLPPQIFSSQKPSRIPLKISFTTVFLFSLVLLPATRKKIMLCFITCQPNVFYLHTCLDKSEFSECTYAYRKPLNSSRCPSLSQHTISNYVLCKLQMEHYSIIHETYTFCALALPCTTQGFYLYTCSLIKSLNTILKANQYSCMNIHNV